LDQNFREGGRQRSLRSGDLQKVQGRRLTEREKEYLRPYLPGADLDNALIFVGQMPFFAPSWAAAITLENNIYVRDPNFGRKGVRTRFRKRFLTPFSGPPSAEGEAENEMIDIMDECAAQEKGSGVFSLDAGSAW
jgi:hypothetical protein